MTEDEADRYRVNEPQIAHECVDGEVVIINLRTGDYYSCRDAAADAWTMLASGASEAEAVAALSRRAGAGTADVAADVAGFVAALRGEDLLVPAESAAIATQVAADSGATAVPYAAPVFEKFSDMADLILLDPVHDVSAEGWPHAREAE